MKWSTYTIKTIGIEIEVEGKEYNDNYTFETPKEGDILDELRAIVEDMEEGNIDKLKIEREA